MRFVEPESDEKTGVVGVDLWAVPGAAKKFDSVVICGVTWTLVDCPPNEHPHFGGDLEDAKRTSPKLSG
jgi:hypothetical protein